MSKITFYGGSGQLYRAAVDIYLSMDSNTSRLEPSQNTALGVLVLTAASIEGFLNELGQMVVDDPDGAPWRPPAANQFGETWRIAEHCKAPTEFKYQLALEAFGGVYVEKGNEPWQSFADLFSIRSRLVHLKPGSGMIKQEECVVEDDSKVFQRLKRHNIMQESSARMDAHWVSLIQTRAAACWACNLASTVVRELIELVPTTWEGIEGDASWRMTDLQPAWLAFEPVAEI